MTNDAVDETVSLRVEVSKEFRTRLRTQSVRLGKKMSEMVEELMDKPLRELELQEAKKATRGEVEANDP